MSLRCLDIQNKNRNNVYIMYSAKTLIVPVDFML